MVVHKTTAEFLTQDVLRALMSERGISVTDLLEYAGYSLAEAVRRKWISVEYRGERVSPHERWPRGCSWQTARVIEQTVYENGPELRRLERRLGKRIAVCSKHGNELVITYLSPLTGS